MPRLTAVDGPHTKLRQNHGATAGCSWTRKSDESRSDHGPGGAGETLGCGQLEAPNPGSQGMTCAPRATRGRDGAHGHDPERRRGPAVGPLSKDGKAEAMPEHGALAKADWGTF